MFECCTVHNRNTIGEEVNGEPTTTNEATFLEEKSDAFLVPATQKI